MTIIQADHLKLAGLAVACLMVTPLLALAQETDTTRTPIEPDKREELLRLKYRLDRPAGEGMLTESGVYEVPEPTEYYTPPFKGQHYLDLAVEAYRRELANRIGPDWLYRFFRAVSPFIHNEFEFGVYQIYDMPVVERENPLFRSNNARQKLD